MQKLQRLNAELNVTISNLKQELLNREAGTSRPGNDEVLSIVRESEWAK